MVAQLPFDGHVADYEQWFEQYPYVFQSELAAIRKLWPAGNNLLSLEIGSATGRFTTALHITEGLEPAENMSAVARARGAHTWCGIAESLPYGDRQFDVVLINFSISYFQKPDRAIDEAHRVLKPGGSLIIGFVDRESDIGSAYEQRRHTSLFYRDAIFYNVDEIKVLLTQAGFNDLEITQTLFKPIDRIVEVEQSMPGHGKGSYVFIKAHRTS